MMKGIAKKFAGMSMFMGIVLIIAGVYFLGVGHGGMQMLLKLSNRSDICEFIDISSRNVETQIDERRCVLTIKDIPGLNKNSTHYSELGNVRMYHNNVTSIDLGSQIKTFMVTGSRWQTYENKPRD